MLPPHSFRNIYTKFLDKELAPGCKGDTNVKLKVCSNITDDAVKEVSLRTLLGSLKLSALQHRAVAAGVRRNEVDKAIDEDDPKSALIALVLSKQSFEARVEEAFMPASFAEKSFQSRDDDELVDQRKRLEELRAMAKRLEGPVQKHPKSGKSLMKKMQDSHLACIPGDKTAPEGENSTKRGDGISDEIETWRNGQLAYWESSSAYKQGSSPEGHVMLLKIARVYVSRDDTRGKSVVVRHKLNNEMQEMILCFPTKRDAEEWSYALWEFISKLREYRPKSRRSDQLG